MTTYGTVGCGLEAMREAWPGMDHVFSVRDGSGRDGGDLLGPPAAHYYGGPRGPRSLLSRHLVNLLVVERGHIRRPRLTDHVEEWEVLVKSAPVETQPKVVVKSWASQAVNWAHGPTKKLARSRWRELGYFNRMIRVSATEIGGAIEQHQLIVAQVKREVAHRWSWGAVCRGAIPRPMGNLLTPPGLARIGKERPKKGDRCY